MSSYARSVHGDGKTCSGIGYRVLQGQSSHDAGAASRGQPRMVGMRKAIKGFPYGGNRPQETVGLGTTQAISIEFMWTTAWSSVQRSTEIINRGIR